VESNPAANEELTLRINLWKQLNENGGPNGVAPRLLRELGLFGGAQGIWVDKARTGKISKDGEGVTVSVLHTGRSYSDDLSDDCVIYHYPTTRRPPNRDMAEINATKAAGRLKLPFFVITYPTPNSAVRDVRLGWVEAWDDQTRTFLITFGDKPPSPLHSDSIDNVPFELEGKKEQKRRDVNARTGQQRFKFQVFQRYGPRCAVCDLGVFSLLDAAHIRPKQADGSDDPRNGLVLCANHHRAFDLGMFAINPATLAIHYRSVGAERIALGLSFDSICHLPKKPHQEAIAWFWAEWQRSQRA
jgi:putative restriction endonuclease